MEKQGKQEKLNREKRLLALAAELGNVAEACRRLGEDRSAYYRALRRAGLAPATAPGRPAAGKMERRVLDLCVAYPEWGCDRIAHYLTLTGDPVSSPTVQKNLIRNGLGRRQERMKRAEEKRLSA